MRILLTNDDGVYAPGLRALRKELKKLGDVTVVAPAGEQSAVGHSITLLTPLLVQEVLDENNKPMGWAVEGRPADCVKLALLELLQGAARPDRQRPQRRLQRGHQRALLRHRRRRHRGGVLPQTSIAVSLEYTKPKPLDFPGRPATPAQVIEQILATAGQPGSLFNVNIPSLEKGPVQGVRVVPQNVAPYQRDVRPPHRPARPGLFLERPGFRLPRPAPRHRRDRPGRGLHHGDAAAVQPDASRSLEGMKSWGWEVK